MPILFCSLCFIVKVKDIVSLSSYHYLLMDASFVEIHFTCGHVVLLITHILFPLRLCYYNPWVILWEIQTFHCQIFRWTKVSLYKEADDKFCKLISPVKVAVEKVEPTTKSSLWMEGPMKLYMVCGHFIATSHVGHVSYSHYCCDSSCCNFIGAAPIFQCNNQSSEELREKKHLK